MNLSIQKLFGRYRARLVTAERYRSRAQKLVDRGIAAETAGRSADAMQYYRAAVEADDSFAAGHMNIGIALEAAGLSEPAIASYERAIAIEPEYPAAHYNLGRAHLVRSRFSQAEDGFRAALRLREDFPEAWVGLAGALEAGGRNEDALLALQRAIALRGDFVGALVNSIALLRKMGRFEAAAANCRRIMELEPENFLAHGTLGIIRHVAGDLSMAEPSYRAALAFNPDYSEVKSNLALLLLATGRNNEAFPLLFDSLTHDPTNERQRRILSEALAGFALDRVGEKERQILLSLCSDDNIEIRFLNPTIISLIKRDEAFETLQRCSEHGEDPFGVVVPEVTKLLRDPLLLAALPRMPIADLALENVLAYLRRRILLRFRLGPSFAAVDSAIPVAFVCALARQCFFSGYAFRTEDDELLQLTTLREELQHMLGDASTPLTSLEIPLAVFALYDYLHTLHGVERLHQHQDTKWSESFRPIVREQLENRERERELVRTLMPLSAIDDATSLAVREQYEENPYPRWVCVQSRESETIEHLSRRLGAARNVRVRPRPVQILIAGCGTGCVPIQFAQTHPDSNILAVDLSLASLAYAARMTQQFGISKVTYKQADILNLKGLDQRFAIVECSGVLHHLHDPMAGWRVLVDLLEADGLMRIGLYSERARVAVSAAREFVSSLNLPRTREGIRSCREAIIGLPAEHPARGVTRFFDFSVLDECRDLIMHVQEHQFTPPRIAECLDALGLRFLGFECRPATLARFKEMFPEPDAATNLEMWHQFENAYPDTFIAMYRFWCCRK